MKKPLIIVNILLWTSVLIFSIAAFLYYNKNSFFENDWKQSKTTPPNSEIISEQFSIDKVKNIVIDTTDNNKIGQSIDVVIETEAKEASSKKTWEAILHHYESDNISLEIENKEDTLFIKVNNLKKRIFRFRFGKMYSNKLIVKLPNSLETDFTVKTLSGDITINDIKNNNFIVSTMSGDVAVSDTTNNNFKISSLSGDIRLENIVAKKDFNASASSGDIYVKNINVNNELIISESSGDINLKGNIYAKHADINAASGEVNFDDCDTSFDTLKVNNISGNIRGGDLSGEINMQSTSGDIRLLLSEEFLGGEFNCISGDIKLAVKLDDFEFNAKTISGYINTDFGSNQGKHFDGKRGKGGNIKILASTTSGDIEVGN